MKTSARNQFTGTVSAVLVGAVNAEVHISLKGGETIVAAITKESVEALAIKEGIAIVALVKAPQIIIVTELSHSPCAIEWMPCVLFIKPLQQ